MYADDISSFADTVVGLQTHINLLKQFSDAICMSNNLNKTKIIVFRNGGPLQHTEKWFYGDSKLEVVSYYKYLGMFLTPNCVGL